MGEPSHPARSRYSVVTHDDETWVQSAGASNLRLHVDPGLTISGAERKRYPRQTIFLDGVHDGPPFLDNEARQYSLDHHEGCVRAFTVATCEQAVIAVLQGLPLEQGEWHLYVNQPDADALLAAWVLLNHADLVREDHRLLRHVMPFVRLESVIDAHGLDGEVLAALPPKVSAAWRAHLDALVAHEREARRSGAWSGDLLEFARAQLERLDGILLPADFLDVLRAVGEVERVELEGDVAAVLCRSDLGIYEVERLLQERHGRHVGLIVLDLGGGHFTLRQSGAFLTRDLTHLYPVLNRRDPHVSRSGGSDRWGGSAEIGGSPRQAGSGLTGPEIMALVAKTYRRRGFWDWLRGR
ncbi:MAG: hypothetical protein HY906_18165 [Deltaproteobacteria bacterium]|nr:hypothetical protein [Deltaproteobacteria bacterium]